MELPQYFTEYEQNIVQDQDFLKTKHKIIEKIHQLFDAFQTEIREELNNEPPQPLLPCNIETGKVSKGDNYEGLPWLISDFPRHFSREKVFALRILFWWGNHFSYNFHLQGSLLTDYRETLISNLGTLIDQGGFYISKGETPWDYHFEGEHFVEISSANSQLVKDLISQKDFIKVGTKVPVTTSFGEVKEKGRSAFTTILEWTGHQWK